MTQLIPMTEEELAAYLEHSIRDYAEEHIRAGTYARDEAYENSKKTFARLLPDGINSPKQYLFSIHDETLPANIGILWFAIENWGGKEFAYVYDFIVKEEYRRRGYGEQAFRLLEDEVRKVGLSEIKLHVFGHNHGARALYEKLGYIITNVNMAKKLDP